MDQIHYWNRFHGTVQEDDWDTTLISELYQWNPSDRFDSTFIACAFPSKIGAIPKVKIITLTNDDIEVVIKTSSEQSVALFLISPTQQEVQRITHAIGKRSIDAQIFCIFREKESNYLTPADVIHRARSTVGVACLHKIRNISIGHTVTFVPNNKRSEVDSVLPLSLIHI